MAPVRTPGVKAAYATAPDPEPYPKSQPSADLSPLLRLILHYLLASVILNVSLSPLLPFPNITY